jgi:hypothetical protein
MNKETYIYKKLPDLQWYYTQYYKPDNELLLLLKLL